MSCGNKKSSRVLHLSLTNTHILEVIHRPQLCYNIPMKLYNTLTRQKELVTPLEGRTIRMYTCGLTVYSQPQIGNWVAYIYADVLHRTLLAHDFTVNRTQNITDVGHLVSDDDDGEDKMEKGARAEGQTAWQVAEKYSRIAEDEAYEQLDLLRPTQLVPATSLIDEQIAFAKKLDEKGYLYRTEDGMYFDTSKIDDYGKLARLDIDGLQAGARVEMHGKKQPTDFAVWKFSPPGKTRDMEWDSPWGRGFPGWHLECSVIARETLGDQIDIHTGGIDHIPVHHTNEIAQTEALTGTQFAQTWFHNNHMKMNGAKLSKSLGNSYTLSDLVKRGFDLDAFKLLVLSSHYRTEGNFTWDILGAAANRLKHWQDYAVLRHQTHDTIENDDDKDDRHGSLLAARHALLERLGDDLDTPAALALIDESFSRLDQLPIDRIHRASLVAFLESIDELLGLHLMDRTPDIDDETKRLLIARQRARDERDWTVSDQLRDQLTEKGIAVSDTPSGQVWRYA